MIVETAIATLITNVVAQFVKTKKPESMTPEEKKKRKRLLRFFTAVISVIAAIGTYWIIGSELPVDSLQSNFEAIVAFAMTFIGSQGTYFLAKDRKASKSE